MVMGTAPRPGPGPGVTTDLHQLNVNYECGLVVVSNSQDQDDCDEGTITGEMACVNISA